MDFQNKQKLLLQLINIFNELNIEVYEPFDRRSFNTKLS